MEFIKSIFNAPWFGTLIGFLGIGIGLLLYFLAKQRKKPAFQQRGLQLLGHNQGILPGQVEIRYYDRVVPRLTKTTIILWNDGDITIDGKEIVESDKLRVEFSDDCEILSCEIRKCTREVNNFRIEKSGSPNIANFTFEFLDKNDGVVLDILHTSLQKNAAIKGTIKGVPAGFEDYGSFLPAMSPKRIKSSLPFSGAPSLQRFATFVAIAFSFFLSLALTSQFYDFTMFVNPTVTKSISIALISIVLCVNLLMLWGIRRRHPMSLAIEGN